MLETAHERVDSRAASGLRGILLQPFAKGSIQGFVLRTGYEAGLLDQGFFSAQGDIFHPNTVYTISVSHFQSARTPVFPPQTEFSPRSL